METELFVIFYLFVAIFTPPLAAGLGLISPYWIMASIAIAFRESLIIVNGADEYGRFAPNEFIKGKYIVAFLTVWQIIVISILYSIGVLVSRFI